MIDPARHQAQLRAVSNQGPEVQCPKCLRRTRDKAGICGPCRKVNAGIDMARFSVAQLRGLIIGARAEIQRRADEAAAALQETP